MKKTLFAAACFLALNGAAYAQSEDGGLIITPTSLEIIVEQKAPRTLIPFSLDELCKTPSGTVCTERYRPDEIVRFAETKVVDFVVRETVYFEGTATEYIRYLNDKETVLTNLGYSLRDETDTLAFRKIPVNVQDMRASLLKALNTYAPDLVDLIKEPLVGDACPQIPEEYIDKVPEKYAEKYKEKIVIVKEALANLNGVQQGLCAIGYNMFEVVGSDPGGEPNEFVKKAIQYKDELIEKLGLSEYIDLLNEETFAKMKSYYDIAKDIDALIKAKQFPGPEQIYDLQKKLNKELPANLQIPEVPNIPVPVPAKPMDLKVKKKKSWPGFVFGQRERVSVESGAWAEIAGSETSQAMTAAGDVTFYIFARPINALGGYGYLLASPEVNRAELKFQALGQDVFPAMKEESKSTMKKDMPNLFSYNFDKAYSQQFMIGPVPVNVKAGARANVGLGYRAGAEMTRLIGAVVPRASAAGYAEGAIGAGGFLSAGAGAELTLLELSVPLTAEAGFRFDEVGYPYLGLRINAEAGYEYLNGRIYAYAEYPVPRVAIPPYKVKRENLDIFTFKGAKVKHKILSWSLDFGRQGAKLGGDLTDQLDKAESDKLSEAIILDQKKQAVADLEASINLKARDIFVGIANDANTEANIKASQQSKEVQAYADQFQQNLNSIADAIAASHI